MKRLYHFRSLLALVIICLITVIGYNTLKKSHAASADVNSDGTVNILDLSIIATNWNKTAMSFGQGDLNGDGSVNVLDLSILATNWGTAQTGTVWHPTADRPYTLQWMLGGALNINDPVQMGLRDLSGNTLPAPDIYDIDGELNTASTVDALHAMGKKVICYIDAGVWEDYRSDATVFPGVQNEGKVYTGDPQYAGVDIIGTADNGWNGSKWMDVRRIDILQPIMTARMQNWCKNKHFDAIEPDEITDWSNNPGFPITYNDQIAYNRAVATWAHNLGLSIGLKGDLEQAHDLVTNFDWTLNEECFLFSECTTINNSGGPGADGLDYPGLQLFAQANKAVWVAEYPSEYAASQRSGSGLTTTTFNSICTTSKQQHFNTALYILGLPATGGRQPCPTTSATTW